jgi:putative membrane protein
MRNALLDAYFWIKAVHVVAIIAWIAGLMYLPRLFVYHHRAEKGGEAERLFVEMERRLLKGIVNPAMIAAWLLGATMVYANPLLLQQPWFLVKLGSAIVISGVHGLYASAQKRFERGERPRSEKFWKIMNEAPFALVIVIAIMVIVRPF